MIHTLYLHLNNPSAIQRNRTLMVWPKLDKLVKSEGKIAYAKDDWSNCTIEALVPELIGQDTTTVESPSNHDVETTVNKTLKWINTRPYNFDCLVTDQTPLNKSIIHQLLSQPPGRTPFVMIRFSSLYGKPANGFVDKTKFFGVWLDCPQDYFELLLLCTSPSFQEAVMARSPEKLQKAIRDYNLWRPKPILIIPK